MDAAKRLDLLRARLGRTYSPGFKPAGVHRAAHPDLPAQKVRKPRIWEPSRPARAFCSNIEPDLANAHRPQWVKVGEEREPEGCRVKRKARVSPLTRIAEQLPGKLPVMNSAGCHSISPSVMLLQNVRLTAVAEPF
jgi:hypothetical protein